MKVEIKKTGSVKKPTLYVVAEGDSIIFYSRVVNGIRVNPMKIVDPNGAQLLNTMMLFDHWLKRTKADYIKHYEVMSNRAMLTEIRACLVSVGLSESDADKVIAKKYGLHARAFDAELEIALLKAEGNAEMKAEFLKAKAEAVAKKRVETDTK